MSDKLAEGAGEGLKCLAVSRYGCQCLLAKDHEGTHDSKCGFNHNWQPEPPIPVYAGEGNIEYVTPAEFYGEQHQRTRLEEDLAMLVRRMMRKLPYPECEELKTQANLFLYRHGLSGSILRSEPTKANEVGQDDWCVPCKDGAHDHCEALCRPWNGECCEEPFVPVPSPTNAAKSSNEEKNQSLIDIANSIVNNPDWRSADLYHALLKAFRMGENLSAKRIHELEGELERLKGQLEAKEGYKLFVWQRRNRFVAMAHALNVADARQAIWDEDGTLDDSVPIRKEMHLMVREQMPVIFRGTTAYAVLTDSAELEESDNYRESQRLKIKQIEAERDSLQSLLADYELAPDADTTPGMPKVWTWTGKAGTYKICFASDVTELAKRLAAIAGIEKELGVPQSTIDAIADRRLNTGGDIEMHLAREIKAYRHAAADGGKSGGVG